MNWLALIAGILTGLAFLVHAIVGGKELEHVAPASGSEKAAEVRLQVINAWHWVSADLLLAGLGFVLIAATDLFTDESVALLGLSIYFLVVGIVWLGTTMITSRARPRTIARLGQWLLCFLIAALAWFAR